MQGQRSTIGSFSETIDFGQGSVSNNTGMNQQTSWNNMLNPVDSRLSNYMLPSNEANFTCVNAVNHDVQNFNGWHLGESSSSMNPRNQVINAGVRMEHGRSSSGTLAGTDPNLEDRRLDLANSPLHESATSGNQITRGPLFIRGSSSTRIPLNVNLNAEIVGNSGSGGQEMGAGLCKLGGLGTEQVSPVSASADNIGASSGSSGSLIEESNGGSGSSLGSWGLSCKRKALEGTSGQSYPGGSSSCSPQAEPSAWLAVPAHSNASNSSSISTLSGNSLSVNPPGLPNQQSGIGMRGVAPSDVFPSLSVTGNAENSQRNFGRRVNPGHQQEPVAFNLSSAGITRRSNVSSNHQSSRPLTFSDSLDLRPNAAVAANANAPQIAPQSQSHVLHIPGLARNMHPFPWSGASNSRAGSSSRSFNFSRERAAVLQEEANLRSNHRNNAEHPMFIPATETRNLAQDPTHWSLATGNINTNGGGPSTSRMGLSSSVHSLPTAWIPVHNPPTSNQQRLSEIAPWTLFPSIESEAGGLSGPFSSLPSGPTANTRETVISAGAISQVHQQTYPRSGFLMERQGNDVLGMPHSLRALAADIEGRHRLISEIRQVLTAMRRGESLRAEDYMLFDPFIYHGMSELQDRHRDMRLDVDNMSYEELLDLEERIGDVNTGLSDEKILKCMKRQKYSSNPTPEVEPCCICQEEYAVGDDLGILDCGHDFHTNCIKQWLMQKNLCPICKTTGLAT